MNCCDMNIKEAIINNINMCCDEQVPVRENVFAIQNIANGLYITSSGEPRGAVRQESMAMDFFRQRWIFSRVVPMFQAPLFRIFDTSTDMLLSIESRSTEDGIPVVTRAEDNLQDQRWFLNVYNDNRSQYFLANDFSLKALSNQELSTTPGTIQVQSTLMGDDNQRFRLVPVIPTVAELEKMRNL